MKVAWLELSDLARALGKTEIEMKTILDAMYALGFPRPSLETGAVPAIHVLDWVVGQQEMQVALALMIQDKLRE